MAARIFQNFRKVWTPRTPDSGYDSLGQVPAPMRIVMAPLISAQMGTGVILQSAIYYAGVAATSTTETVGTSVKLQAASYTAPPPPP
jgi:hypothetical protein